MATATGNYRGTGALQNINTGLGKVIKSLTIVQTVSVGRAYTTDALQAGVGTDKFLDNFAMATGIKISTNPGTAGIFTLTGAVYNTNNQYYYWEANA